MVASTNRVIGQMDWEHFRGSAGKFKVKRLPKLKCKVSVKDITDLEDLRSMIPPGASFESACDTYQRWFSSASDYDIEMDEFDEWMDRALYPEESSAISDLRYWELGEGVNKYSACESRSCRNCDVNTCCDRRALVCNQKPLSRCHASTFS